MNALKQIGAVTAVALEAIPRRLGSSLVVVIGTATTVAVLISALAVATGFTRAAAKSGSPDRAIVLGGLNEASSGISPENVATIMDAPGVAHTSTGRPIASAEVLRDIPVTDSHTGQDVYITVRGVGSEALVLRPEIQLAAGRLFEPGRREVIVGQGLEERFGGLSIGSSIAFPDGDWKVVGIFSSGGGSHESEILTDAASLVNALHRNEFNSVTVRLAGRRDFARFSAALASNPTLSVKAQREDEYYATASGAISHLLEITAYGLGGIMAFGAVFGALNTMFSAVRARRTEIATLRAIGFGGISVAASVVIEALLLGLTGALLGALAARLLLDGARISTIMSTDTFSHITFGLEVGPRLILIGVLFALGIASAGGVFAATQASRISVAAGMRET
ncbi:MAG: FtsX-like permease family protein [Steroidobacteraceae bacterium]